MKKIKRISAILCVIVLVCLYLSTLIFAFFDHSKSLGLLKASLALTFVLPVLLYGYLLFCKLSHKNDEHIEE